MNFKEETIGVLQANNKTIFDIKWVGTWYARMPLENFFEAWDCEYDNNGFGSQEVAHDLMVVGEDWWLERHVYGGSECWEFKELPKMPTTVREYKKVIGGGMWATLQKINEEDKKMKKIVLYDVYIKFMGEKELISEGHETLEEAKERVKEEKENHKHLPVPACFCIEKRSKTVEESGERLIALVEKNGWERETWRWWVPEEFYKNNKDTFDIIEKLFERIGTVNQQIGFTKFYIDKNPKDKNEIDFEGGQYLPLNTLISPNNILNKEYIDTLEKDKERDLFDVFYKGGIVKLFKNKGVKKK